MRRKPVSTKSKTKSNPRTVQTLARDVRRGRPLDGRTAVSKMVVSVRDQLEKDPLTTTRALLLSSASHSAVVAQLALKRAMENAEAMLSSGTNVNNQALGIYQRFDSSMRASLKALARLPKDGDGSDQIPKTPESLSELIVDLDPEPDVKAQDPDQESD